MKGIFVALLLILAFVGCAGRPNGSDEHAARAEEKSGEHQKPDEQADLAIEEAPGTQEILDRMAEVYRQCATYSDSGIVTKYYVMGKKTIPEKRGFETAFARPNRFVFQSGSGSDSDTVHWGISVEGSKVITVAGVEGNEATSPSLNEAIERVTGTSWGAAHTVPALLLPDKVSGPRLPEMQEAKRIQDGKQGASDCYRIQGKWEVAGILRPLDGRPGPAYPTTVWVDKATFLVRRIDQQIGAGDYRTDIRAVYEPEINRDRDELNLWLDLPIIDWDPP